jgi:colanic acid biosynthesis glycosyl transferase WcaI
VLSINYFPEPTGFAPHAAGFCEYLSSRGHKVTVFTGFPFAPYWSRWKEYKGNFILHENIKKVDVVRVTHFIPRRAGHFIQRLLMEGSFCLVMAGIFLTHLRSRPDVIIYMGAQPSIAMLARLIAKWKRLPYLVSINDLAAQAAGEVGIVKSGMLLEMLSAFEFASYRKASGAMVLCSSFRDSLLAHRYRKDRIRIIPSPVDVERIRPVPDGAGFRDAHGLSARDFVVLYSGSMGLKQGMTNVVEAARMLQMWNGNPGIKWVLVGDGQVRPVIENLIADCGLKEFVRLIPLQPESEMSSMFSAADVLLLNQLSKVKDTVIPSKLLTYMAAGRPVLAAVNPASQGALLLAESQGGVIVDPENPAALAAAVKQLQANPTALQEMGRRNRQYAEKNLDRRRIFAAQEAFLGEIVRTAFPAA